ARADLAETALELTASGVGDLGSFEWFEAPPTAAFEAATGLLRRLGAIHASGSITDVGRRMLRFPLHPRPGRMIVEAARRGIADVGCALAALVGERALTPEPRSDAMTATARARHRQMQASDLLAAYEELGEAERGRGRALGVDSARLQAITRVRE